MNKPWIKVCGVTCAEDIELLVDSGATAVGLNLWSQSPRCVSEKSLLELTQLAKGRLDVVWVTVDMELTQLSGLAEAGNPDWIQLHGDQGPEYLDALGPKAFYAVGLKDQAHVDTALNAPGALVLIDARDEKLKGGTGVLAPLELAVNVCKARPTVLAGGLTPENVGDRISSCRPAGVDTASGVEITPGKKDPEKVRRFCESARQAFDAQMGRVSDV